MSSEGLQLAESYITEWFEFMKRDNLFRSENNYEKFHNDSKRAQQLLAEILKENPNNQEARIQLARWHLCQYMYECKLLIDDNHLRNAIMHMEKVIEVFPDVPEYRLGLCHLYSRYGNKKSAIEQLEKCVELDPGNMNFKKELDRVKTKSEGCFIASAVFESIYSYEVKILRNFRDRTLLVSPLGRLFVRFYYYFSPSIAFIVSKNKPVKYFLRYYFFKPFIKYLIKSEKWK